MEKLSDLIKGRLGQHALSESAKSAEVIFKANGFLLPRFTEGGVKAYRFERGILYIAAENSVYSQELWGVKAALLKELRQCFDEKTVLNIRIKSLTIK